MRAIDWSLESLLDQVWDVAAVVDVGMAEYDAIDCGGIEREIPVSLVGVFSPALIQTAID